MNKTIIAIAITVVFAATPSDSEARADRNGLDACARAMTDQMASAQGSPVEFRLAEGPETTGNRSTSSGTWYLDAKHPETHEVVARIDCRVDARARVVSLRQVPLTANDAAARAAIE